MNRRIEILLARATRLDEGAVSRRRDDLVQRAVDAGLSREYADQMYDVATEEDLDPAVAFEVVLSGVGVRELAGPASEAWEETQVEAPPSWIADLEQLPVDVARERRTRNSFRRLRQIMEHTTSPRAAIFEFVDQADVGPVDY
jgi:hypothetical protein